MFLILDSSNLIVDISPHAHYVCRQTNNKVIGCSAEKADAIYSANTDKFYPLERTGYIGDSHTMAEVSDVPSDVVAGYWYFSAGEFYTTDEKQAELMRSKIPDDMLEMVVDQEYRLTLLELGVI